MPRVLLVVGLPGSGKTNYAKELANVDDGILLDGPKDWSEITNALFSHKLIVVTDPLLCFKEKQSKAKQQFTKLGITPEWVYFENNPDQCLRNVAHRNAKGSTDINFLSKNYFIPKGIITLPVSRF